jgi:AcrR family transcriptional regulator
VVPRSSTPATSRLSADERREAIVAAALDEFAARGLAGASTDAIAARAGVSQPYVFQLFGTKKELFLAVVRHAFRRTHLTFEKAARRQREGLTADANTVLDALGKAYVDLLRDRTLLLVQLQAYAACSDTEVRRVVGDEYAAIYRYVREASGAGESELTMFFAHGMLLNVAAAVDLEGHPEAQALATLGGRH